MPRLAFRLINTANAIPALPRLTAVGHERQDSPAYHRALCDRKDHGVAVQFSLSGCGALWDVPGPWRGQPGWREIPAKHAMIVIFGEDDLSYGYPPGASAPWEFVFANLAGEAAITMARGLIAARGHIIPLASRTQVVRDLLRLPLRGRSGPGWRMLTAEANCRLASEVIAALATEEDPGDDLGKIEQAMSLLDEDPLSPPSIRAVAARLGLSREHLTRVFTARVGMPPARWCLRQRLLRAERLLEEEESPLAEVAARTGFASAAHFIRTFGSIHGLSPGSWRKRRRNQAITNRQSPHRPGIAGDRRQA